MKINIYIILACVGMFLIFTDTYAGWYGLHTVAISGTKTNCDEDASLDATAPNNPDYSFALSNPPYSETVTLGRRRQAQLLGRNANPALIDCYYWDSTLPTATSITHPFIWSNSTTIPINMTSGDSGGSGLKAYEVQLRYANDFPTFTAWTAWTTFTYLTTSLGATSYNAIVPAGIPARAYVARFRTVDNAGNTGAWLQAAGNYLLDGVNPVATSVTYPNIWSSGTNLPISMTATDNPGSGLSRYEVQIRSASDSPTFTAWTAWSTVANFLSGATSTSYNSAVPAGIPARYYQAQFRVIDNAGNTGAWLSNPALNYKLDGVAPLATSITYPNGWFYSNSVTISMAGSDNPGSGLSAYEIEYRSSINSPLFGGGWSAWTTLATVFTGAVTTNYTYNAPVLPVVAYEYRYRTVDNVGNRSAWTPSAGLQYKIDRTNPVVSATNSSATWKNANISITLSGTDADSGLSNLRYIWHLNNAGVAPTVAVCLASGTPYLDGQVITLSTEGNHTLYLCAQDNVGNQGSWNGVYRLDKTNPIMRATNDSLVWQAAPIALNFLESDPIPYAGAIVSQTSTRKYYWDYNDVLGAATVNFAYCMANGTNYVNNDAMVMNTPGGHTLYVCGNDVATNNSALWTGIYRFDNTPPTASNLLYANATTNGWTNNTTITLNWNASDPMPGSGLKNHDVRIYESVGNAQDPIMWNLTGTVTTAGAAPTYTYVGLNGKAYKFEVLPRDNANNVPAAWTVSADIARIDTTSPSDVNLIATTATNLLATGSQNFRYTYNDGGAPITLTGQIEDKNNPAGFLASFASPAHAYVQAITHDISVVDAGGNRNIDSNSARQYTHRITTICDQAGNCWNGAKNYNYNVYSNPDYNLTLNPNTAAFGGSIVADGTIKTWQAQLVDGFGNIVIQAPGISRTVDYNLNGITNAMYLNQVSRGGATSVYLVPLTGPEVGLSFNPTQALGLQVSTDGNYPLGIKAYTPTSNGHIAGDTVSDPNATFGFTINLTVADTLTSGPHTVSNASPGFRYEPLFRTVIHGEINDGGFIEGTEQSSLIDVIQNPLVGAIGLVGADTVQLSFSGSETSKFDFYANSTSPVSTAIGQNTPFTVSPGFHLGTVANHPLLSQLVQKPNIVVTNLSNLWLASHLSYTLDGKAINTNSDIIGKSSYFGAPSANLGNQVGVKIIGAVSSKYINNMLNGQFESGTVLLNYQSRSEVRNKIKKNISLALRNTATGTVGTAITNLGALPVGAGAIGSRVDQNSNGSIMYIEAAGGDIVLSTGAVSGIKTLVIKGANLWIMRDMYYTNNQSILGVVVQKDESGNGGNLYISPSVTNVVGAYILDGSIISYNGAQLGYNTQASILKNQLLIYGTIVSENSIGGSRATTPICPSLLGIGACTMEVAQTYDLNYLRRYYLVVGAPTVPAGGAIVAGQGTCAAGICVGFDPKLKKLFSSTTEDLARYPIIIEYNPLIQRTPPIGFGNVLGE